MDNLEFRRFDRSDLPVVAYSVDYTDGHITGWHQHPNAQLLHAVQGIMRISTTQGQWLVPPSRAIWMPPAIEHSVCMIGQVKMRTVFIQPLSAPRLWPNCQVVGISPLLRELLLAATHIGTAYSEGSRDWHLIHLLLEEIRSIPALPLQLPNLLDSRLQVIASTLRDCPDDPTTVKTWATRLHITPKTIHRLFLNETGMTFGQWRQQTRLLAALERLAKGDKVVTVALEMGYNSPSAFAAMFKRQFGVTPSQFFE